MHQVPPKGQVLAQRSGSQKKIEKIIRFLQHCPKKRKENLNCVGIIYSFWMLARSLSRLGFLEFTLKHCRNTLRFALQNRAFAYLSMKIKILK